MIPADQALHLFKQAVLKHPEEELFFKLTGVEPVGQSEAEIREEIELIAKAENFGILIGELIEQEYEPSTIIVALLDALVWQWDGNDHQTRLDQLLFLTFDS